MCNEKINGPALLYVCTCIILHKWFVKYAMMQYWIMWCVTYVTTKGHSRSLWPQSTVHNIWLEWLTIFFPPSFSYNYPSWVPVLFCGLIYIIKHSLRYFYVSSIQRCPHFRELGIERFHCIFKIMRNTLLHEISAIFASAPDQFYNVLVLSQEQNIIKLIKSKYMKSCVYCMCIFWCFEMLVRQTTMWFG